MLFVCRTLLDGVADAYEASVAAGKFRSARQTATYEEFSSEYQPHRLIFSLLIPQGDA